MLLSCSERESHSSLSQCDQCNVLDWLVNNFATSAKHNSQNIQIIQQRSISTGYWLTHEIKTFHIHSNLDINCYQNKVAMHVWACKLLGYAIVKNTTNTISVRFSNMWNADNHESTEKVRCCLVALTVLCYGDRAMSEHVWKTHTGHYTPYHITASPCLLFSWP